jgi:hypothetical protein
LSLLGLVFDFQFWQLPDFGNFGSFPASSAVKSSRFSSTADWLVLNAEVCVLCGQDFAFCLD